MNFTIEKIEDFPPFNMKPGTSFFLRDEKGVFAKGFNLEYAALLAAAPELLEALQYLEKAALPLGSGSGGTYVSRPNPSLGDALQKARAAIKKATTPPEVGEKEEKI